jgi:hypothetical protein
MNPVFMVLGGIAGAAATSLLQRKYGISAVVASALVGLLGAGVGSLASDVNLSAVVFAGSFAGMTAVAVVPLVPIAIAGAGAGALYALAIRFDVFPGYGGRLGTVAFISTLCMIWIATGLAKR